MPEVDVGNGKVFYQVYGAGRPLVLVHGAWASHEWWKWQIPELSQSYRVLAMDVRGHGRSSPLQQSYSMPGFRKDLDVLLDCVGIDRTALVGWSMGGIISMEYCLAHPSKVEALILIGVRSRFGVGMRLRILSEYVRSVLGLMSTFLTPRKYDFNAAEEQVDLTERFAREARQMVSPEASEEVVQWLAATMARTPFGSFFEIARSIWTWKAGPELSRIQAPTLIIVGEKDLITPPSHSRRLHHLIPHSRLIVVDGASHYVAMERPDLVSSAIRGFLTDLGYH